MHDWEQARRAARARHDLALAAAGGDALAAALLASAERLTGVARVPVPSGDPLLDGADALLDAAAGVIVFDSSVEPWRAAFYQAHEYAHLWLDGDRACCAGPDMEPGADADGVTSDLEQVVGYSPRERREREANAFALEFLLPCPLLRHYYHAEGLDAAAIAVRSGLPESLVWAQLARALLAPPAGEDVPSPSPGDLDLDDSQRLAAHAPRGPLLLEAGPGTGKTRTLVARILFLLEQGVPAASILALTFSRRAAEEMRARVAAVAPRAAADLWMGTFHAFGLELLRKYGEQIGLPPAPEVLDPLGALSWLEQRLPELDVDHERMLYDPALALRDVLTAISRAKDELIGPDAYAALVERAATHPTGSAGILPAPASDGEPAGSRRSRDGAPPDDSSRSMGRLEVARVYAFYQRALRREGLLDFGDLIARAVELLRAHSEVRDAVRRAYPHILVDEYQDVNRASGLLLREMAGDGAGLWVVGDARQAIYRFRGAAPANMRLFTDDFPGATVLALRRNYRSRPAIVSGVAAVASRMRAASAAPFVPWEAQRSTGGELRLEVAANEQAELAGLARAIEQRRAAGLRYGDQAVLCRSHTALARVAAGLESAGIPVHYLGDVFERPEVRDMLALLSLVCEGEGLGLVRVAGFAEYAIPHDDVMAVLRWAGAEGVRFPRAVALACAAPGLSARGKEGLSLLARHLEGLAFGTDAWTLLARYLFSRSSYLRTLAGDGPASAQRRLALYRFLQFATDRRQLPAWGDEDPKKAFLRNVRRLESLGEDRGVRQPGGVTGIDAVHLLTIHASKGLEFSAVYLPMLARRYFPAPRRHEPYALPPETLTAPSDEHDEEEECLFFVAVSRARDLLVLSRAQRYGRQSSKPSQLLGLLDGALPAASDDSVTWPAAAELSQADEAVASPTPDEPRSSIAVEALETYLSCPRHYYYAHELNLSQGDADDAYSRFRRCLRAALDWAWQRAASEAVTSEAALARFDVAWQAAAPRPHPHDDLYRRTAAAMIARVLAQPSPEQYGAGVAVEWEVELPRGGVLLRPHRVGVVDADGAQRVVAQQVRTSRGEGGERQKRLAALYHSAAARAYPAARRQIQTVSLATGEARDVSLDDATAAARLAPYDQAIAGIADGRFAARPDDRRCPRCPYYFICPAPQQPG